MNKVGIYIVKKDKVNTKFWLDKVLSIQPDHQKAKYILNNLNAI